MGRDIDGEERRKLRKKYRRMREGAYGQRKRAATTTIEVVAIMAPKKAAAIATLMEEFVWSIEVVRTSSVIFSFLNCAMI